MKIAIANSQLLVRDSISRMLSADAGFEICINAANGNELINSLSRVSTLPDLCLLDVQMPQMNGYETMNIIRQSWPGLKVLVFSQLEDDFVIESMLSLGVKSYLGKDCTITELQKALVSVHEKGYYRSALMARISESAGNKSLCFDVHEYTYLKYCHTELTAKEIAGVMNVSPAAVYSYRKSLLEKLKLSTRQGLAMFALKTGIVAPGDIKFISHSRHLPAT